MPSSFWQPGLARNTPGDATGEELEWLAAAGKEAYDHFVTANTRLAASIARKQFRSRMDMIDIIQEANFGLMRAVEKFDFTKGYKFSTYATWWIRQSIARGASQQERTVRLPVHVDEEIRKMHRVTITLAKQMGAEPALSDIANVMDVDESRVMDLRDWSRDTVSLDAALSDDGDSSLGDFVVDTRMQSVESAAVANDEHEQLMERMSRCLDPRQEDILVRRFGLKGHNLEKLAQIGRRHGIGAERVRQLEYEALRILKQSFVSESKTASP